MLNNKNKFNHYVTSERKRIAKEDVNTNKKERKTNTEEQQEELGRIMHVEDIVLNYKKELIEGPFEYFIFRLRNANIPPYAISRVISEKIEDAEIPIFEDRIRSEIIEKILGAPVKVEVLVEKLSDRNVKFKITFKF